MTIDLLIIFSLMLQSSLSFRLFDPSTWRSMRFFRQPEDIFAPKPKQAIILPRSSALDSIYAPIDVAEWQRNFNNKPAAQRLAAQKPAARPDGFDFGRTLNRNPTKIYVPLEKNQLSSMATVPTQLQVSRGIQDNLNALINSDNFDPKLANLRDYLTTIRMTSPEPADLTSSFFKFFNDETPTTAELNYFNNLKSSAYQRATKMLQIEARSTVQAAGLLDQVALDPRFKRYIGDLRQVTNDDLQVWQMVKSEIISDSQLKLHDLSPVVMNRKVASKVHSYGPIEKQMVEDNIARDGQCQFASISKALPDKFSSANQVRQFLLGSKALSEMDRDPSMKTYLSVALNDENHLTNPERQSIKSFKDFFGAKDFNGEYKLWGNQMSLTVLAKELNVQFRIIQGRDVIVSVPENPPNGETKVVFLSLSGQHYNSVQDMMGRRVFKASEANAIGKNPYLHDNNGFFN